MLKKNNVIKKSNSMIKSQRKADIRHELDDISRELDDLTEMFLGSNKKLQDRIAMIQKNM